MVHCPDGYQKTETYIENSKKAENATKVKRIVYVNEN